MDIKEDEKFDIDITRGREIVTKEYACKKCQLHFSIREEDKVCPACFTRTVSEVFE